MSLDKKQTNTKQPINNFLSFVEYILEYSGYTTDKEDSTPSSTTTTPQDSTPSSATIDLEDTKSPDVTDKPKRRKFLSSEKSQHSEAKRYISYDMSLPYCDWIEYLIEHNTTTWPDHHYIDSLIEDRITIDQKLLIVIKNYWILKQLHKFHFSLQVISQIFHKLPLEEAPKYFKMLLSFMPFIHNITEGNKDGMDVSSIAFLLQNSQKELPMKLWILECYSDAFPKHKNILHLGEYIGEVKNFIAEHPISFTSSIQTLSTQEEIIQNFTNLIVHILTIAAYSKIVPMIIQIPDTNILLATTDETYIMPLTTMKVEIPNDNSGIFIESFVTTTADKVDIWGNTDINDE